MDFDAWYRGCKIMVVYVNPPIPSRNNDYCAYIDDLGADSSPYGWGKTPTEAMMELVDAIDDLEEGDIPCIQ